MPNVIKHVCDKKSNHTSKYDVMTLFLIYDISTIPDIVTPYLTTHVQKRRIPLDTCIFL